MYIKQYTTTLCQFFNIYIYKYIYIYIYIYYIYKNYGSVLVACGSKWDFFIFRAAVKLQFLILFHAAQWSKMPSTQP